MALTRREFLRALGLGSASVLLASCGRGNTPQTPSSTPDASSKTGAGNEITG
jgi:hypothetical protein